MATDTVQFFPDGHEGCYWVRARVCVPAGEGEGPRRYIAEVGHHGQSTLYVLQDGKLVAEHEMGNDLPLDGRAYPHVWSSADQNVAPLTLRPGTTYDLLLRYANPLGTRLYGTSDALALSFQNARAHDKAARLHLLISGLMVGGLLMLMFYQAAQWTVYRSALDATYCLMLMGLIVFVCYDDYLFHGLLSDRVVGEKWLYFTGGMGLFGFFRFAQLTLRAVDYQPHRDRLLGWLVIQKAIEAPVLLLLVSFAAEGPPWLQYVAGYIPETFRLLLIFTLIVFSYAVVTHFRVNKDKTTYTFLVGNLSLVAGVMLVVLRGYLLPYATYAPVRWYLLLIEAPFDYLIELGIAGMALCFAFAVALLTKDREANLERAYNRRLAQVRMEALRSQMNPHFLFNGLNAIKLFVINSSPRLAGDYLSRFARLIRLVLENSQSPLITLARELETLELYVRLESLRFTPKFSYEVVVDEGIDRNAVYLPPTLLQPFAENAIWHGLLHREREGGHLRICVGRASAGRLRLVVEDNGVGRAYAAQRNAGKTAVHRSLGMQITSERIAMLRELYGFDADVEVVDLFDAGGAAAGTRVVVRLTPRRKPLNEDAELAMEPPRRTGEAAYVA